jgi:hypothetical protein
MQANDMKNAVKLFKKRRTRVILGTVISVLIVIGVVCSYAIYHNSDQKAKTVVTGKSEYSFSGKKSQYIDGYASAPVSLQQSLINQYYDQAKNSCITANETVSQNVQSDKILRIETISGNFALVQFCGSGGDSIFDHINGSWKIIGNEADYPGCSLVNQYKITKKIVPQCYDDSSGKLVNVTYP